MSQSMVKYLWMLAIGLFVVLGTAAEAQAGDEVKISGTIVKGKKGNGKPKWSLKLEDGKAFVKSKHDVKIQDIKGRKKKTESKLLIFWGVWSTLWKKHDY